MPMSFTLFPQTDSDINETMRAVLLALTASGLGITKQKADDMLASDLLLLSASMVGKEPT